MYRATIGKDPSFISANQPVTVRNAAGAAAFHKASDDVDSGDTELAAGATVTLTDGQYFISASSTEIVVTELKIGAFEDVAVADDLTVGGDAAIIGNATVTGNVEIDGELNHDGAKVGFFGIAPAARPEVKKAELTANELATELAKLGIVKVEA